MARPGPGWRAVLAYAAVSAANQMLWLTFTPVTSDAAAQYGVSRDAIGWLAELFPLVYVVVALPAGRLLDAHLTRWLGLGAVVTAAGAVLRMGHSYQLVLVGQVLVALAQPLVLNAVTRTPALALPAAQRPRGIAVSSAGVFAGMVLALGLGAAFGGGHLGPLIETQAVLAVIAAAWLLTHLPALARAQHGLVTDRHVDVDADVDVDVGTVAPVGIRAALGRPGMRSLLLLSSLGFGTFVALTTWLQTLLEPAGVGESTAGVLLLVMVVSGVVGAGVLADRLVARGAQAPFLLVAVTGGALACLLLAGSPGTGTGLLAAIVLGGLLLTALPVVLELADRDAGAGAGATVSALVWLTGNAAGLVVALVVQAVKGHPAVAFVVLAGVLTLGAPLVPRISRVTTQRREGVGASSLYEQ